MRELPCYALTLLLPGIAPDDTCLCAEAVDLPESNVLRATALSDRDARGGFSLALCPCLCLQVPDSSRADPNAPLPELDGFLRLRTLVPRSPPGSTVRPKQQAGAGRSPRKWKRKGAGASGRSSSSPDKASPGAASTGSGGGGGGRDSPPSTPGPVSAADAAAVAQALESAAGSLALKASPPPPGSLNLEPVKWHWGGSEPEPELEPELEPETEPEPERQ